MINYKVQASGKWAPTPSVTNPGSISGYAHMTYEVVETTTDQVIKTDMTQSEAKALCRHLNFGGGFDGFTPAFFTQKGKLYYDEDSFFS